MVIAIDSHNFDTRHVRRALRLEERFAAVATPNNWLSGLQAFEKRCDLISPSIHELRLHVRMDTIIQFVDR